jgi:hypothetical protein
MAWTEIGRIGGGPGHGDGRSPYGLRFSGSGGAGQAAQSAGGSDRRDLAEEDGWTVAHKVAEEGHLPEGFDRWELTHKNGWTVLQAAPAIAGLRDVLCIPRWPPA